MFVSRRRRNSLKLLLWFLFQHPRLLTRVEEFQNGSFGECCGESGRCRCHRVSTPIAVTKSGAEGGRAAWCLRNRLRGNKRGASDGQRTSRRHVEASLGAAVVIKFLSRGTKES